MTGTGGHLRVGRGDITRLLLGLLALTATGRADWGSDRQLLSGVIGQHGLAAARTRGPDTVFAGAVVSGTEGDTLKLLRSLDRGESWSLIWQAAAVNRRLSQLNLDVVYDTTGWVTLFWLVDDGSNNGDISGARVALDGSSTRYLEPVPPGPDTVYWLRTARSYEPAPVLHLFWQDEAGLPYPVRNPEIRYCRSSDLGLSWTAPVVIAAGFEYPAADCGAPGYIFLASSDARRRDIRLDRSTDGGVTWQYTMLSSDSTRAVETYPSVAATHDSAPDGRVWVSYDWKTPETGIWLVRCAYSTNSGGTWVLNRQLSSGSNNQFWSRLSCAADGARTVRACYLNLNSPGDYRVCQRAGIVANPAFWSAQLEISDSAAANSQAPCIIDCGLPGDSASLGIMFYCQPGPRNIWYDAQQFIGLAEPVRAAAGRSPGLTVRRAGDELLVDCAVTVPGWTRLDLYDAAGRHRKNVAAGRWAAGNYTFRVPRPAAGPGSMFLILRQSDRVVGAQAAVVR